MSEATQPICTIAVKVGDDQMFVPDAFDKDLVPMLAALDWSRVFNAQQNYAALEQELAAVARHARALANLASDFARTAHEATR